MNRREPWIAKPRFTGPQQTFSPSVGSFRWWCQISLPVRASIAHAWLRGPVMYMMPSTTIGVASNWPVTPPVWKVHCGASCAALAGVICFSGLWRWPV
jgi:hypothetical protein